MAEKAPIVVVALGGNALIRQGERGDVGEQLRHIRESVAFLPLLLNQGWSVLITHGNGPIVGQLLLQNEAAGDLVPAMPLDVCDADSEGSVGYLIQQTLANELNRHGVSRQVVSLVTQIVVDAEDPGFSRPSKPVGPFYPAAEVEKLRRERGWSLVEDAGRGYRRVVPSPRPVDVVEREAIRILLDHGVVVVAAGGGGIPVTRDENGAMHGVEAVIDKDRASALLAKTMDARRLIILTAVEYVYTGFGQPGEKPLPLMSTETARNLLAAGEFPPGSMGPKIEAAIEFLEEGGEEVLITLPERLGEALEGKTGTRIVRREGRG
jgi:carbamate kinase